MKKLFLILFIPLISLSQELPYNDNGDVVFEEIIVVDSVSKQDLYNKSYKWIVKNYNSANDVVQYKDSVSGEIVCKGLFAIHYYSRRPKIQHTLTISVKNNKARIVFSDLTYSDVQGESFNIEDFPRSWFGEKKLYKEIDEKIQDQIAGYKLYITRKTNDDW